MPRTLLSLLFALVLTLTACGADDGEVAVDDLEDEVTEEPADEPDDGPDDAPDEGAEAPEDADTGDETGDEGQQAPDGADAPEPDPARVEEPCAEREGGEMDAFLDVVAPVDGQQVSGELELVGCANVPEGTVRYRVVSPDGDALVDDFTTAECGGPCVGAYATTIDLAPAADHESVTLEVFWDSPADGGEEDLTEIELVVG